MHPDNAFIMSKTLVPGIFLPPYLILCKGWKKQKSALLLALEASMSV